MTLDKADKLMELLYPHLKQFKWFKGIGIEETLNEDGSFFVTVRVAEAMPLEAAEAKARALLAQMPDIELDKNVKFEHMPDVRM